jgi:hypothetical protein
MTAYNVGDVAYHITQNSLIISADGMRKTIPDTDEKYAKAMDYIREDDMESLRSLVIPGFDISKYSHLEIYVHKGKLYRFGEPVSDLLAKTVIKLMDKGLPYQYLLNFWDRLKENPEPSSVEQLYNFLLANDIPITPEGYIMAYKSVQKKPDGIMYDHHSGSVQYFLHKTVSMPREEVVCSPDRACGPGLHVGSYRYAKDFSSDSNGVILEVLVDPKNVVSVPRDCNQQKCRTCELFVSAICDKQTEEAVYKPPKKAKKELKKKEGDKMHSETNRGTKIGRYFYAKKNISPSYVDQLTDLKEPNPYLRLVKSDFPIFFQRLKVTEVYRQRNGKSSNYIAGTNSVYIHYEKKN